MAETPKRPANVTQGGGSKDKPETSRVAKPGSKAAGETAKATDSVPLAVGPFPVLPVQFGRYQVQKELGRGQMGAVYLAMDTELDRHVALKVARTSSTGSVKLVKRMEVEAKAAAVVDHPQICKVYDAGEIDGIRFIALQYVEGENLKQFLKRTGRRQKPKEAVRLVLQILRALEAAHEKGIIHRDLKPENVMLNKKFQPIIMDFGLARRTIGSSDAGLTQGMVVGTAAYMSPEQAVGKPEGIDHRSDLYAVGVMLFEMLTGEWPFVGGQIEVMGRKLVQDPPSPHSVNPDLTPQLSEVCHKMIAQKKEDRFETCETACKALEAIDLAPSVQTGSQSGESQVPTGFEFLKEIDAGSINLGSSQSTVKKRSGRRSAADVSTISSQRLSSKSPIVRWTLFGIICATLVILAGILSLPVQDGVVQIEIDNPTLSVSFEGKTITVANDGSPIRVKPVDSHKLKILHDEITIESATQEIVVMPRKTRVVKLTLVDGDVAVDGKTVAKVAVQPKLPKSLPEVAARYRVACEDAGKQLLAAFDNKIAKIRAKAGAEPLKPADQNLITIIFSEKAIFANNGEIPFSPAMRDDAIAYLRAIEDAENDGSKMYDHVIEHEQLSDEASAAEKKLQFRTEFLTPKLVGKLQITEVNGKQKGYWSFYSNGTFDGRFDFSKSTWRLDRFSLIATHPRGNAPGGAWIDTGLVEENGQTVNFSNQQGYRQKGIRVVGK